MKKLLTFGALIRLTREAAGLTLREVEKESGISNALISQLETGWIGDLSFHKAIKLGRALGLTLSEMENTRVAKKSRRGTKMRQMQENV